MATNPSPLTPGTPADDPNNWLLKRRHEELGTTFRAAWDNYIKFYTVFLPFSLVAMGWIVAQEGHALAKFAKWVISVVFIIQTTFTAITSASLARYSQRVADQYVGIEKDLLGDLPPAPAIVSTKSIPVSLAKWAGWANAVGMALMVGAWIYIGFWMP